MFHFPTRDISIAEMGIYAPLKPTAKKTLQGGGSSPTKRRKHIPPKREKESKVPCW